MQKKHSGELKVCKTDKQRDIYKDCQCKNTPIQVRQKVETFCMLAKLFVIHSKQFTNSLVQNTPSSLTSQPTYYKLVTLRYQFF